MTAALQTLLMEHFRATAPAVNGQPFLAFELGTPIPDETFHLPADNPAYSPALALEYLSQQANMAPRVQDGVLFETSNRIDNLFEVLLIGAVPVDTSGMELLGLVKRRARAAFDETLGSVASAAIERFRPTHADPVNWYDQQATDNWTTLRLNQVDNPPPPPDHGGSAPPRSLMLRTWMPAPEPLRSRLAEPVSMHLVRAFREPPPVVLPFVIAPLDTAVEASPVAERSMQHVMLAHRRRLIEALVEPPDARVRMVHDAMRLHPERVAPAVNDAPAITPPPTPPVQADGFSITVEVCLVHLRRPWLADGLLNLTNWCVPTVAKGTFSDGTGPGTSTPLAVLPVACVFIRKLAISAHWTDDDKSHAESSSHLGTFSLLGRRFDQNSALLSVDGMQTIAWICQPLPVLPPQDPTPTDPA
jgi:hypothetical protein